MFLIGCSSTPPECKADSDCAKKACNTVKCEKKKCDYTVKKNCCGNGMKEETEDGKKGNTCACPADYGKCEGRGKIKAGTKEVDAKYLERICKDDKCVLDVNKDNVNEIQLIDDKFLKFFRLESIISFNKPFIINKDKINIKFTLKDVENDLVFPIKITNIKFIKGEYFYGETPLDIEFTAVGNYSEISIPLDYEMQSIEEEKILGFRIDYEYLYKVKVGKNDTEIRGPERTMYDKQFGEKIFFVSAGGEN